MAHQLEVAEADLEAVVLCLALGTLQAMRDGGWPLEAGIWTLGRPVLWEPLVNAGLDQAVIEILQSADELSLLEEMNGRVAAETRLDLMIADVRLRLAALTERYWHAHWATRA